MGPIKYPKQYCGEVFITNNYLMMLECKFCTKEFVPYDEFLKHIFDVHFDSIEVYGSDTEDDNSDEMDIINAHESDGETPSPNSIVHFECEMAEQSTEISTSNTIYQEKSAAIKPYIQTTCCCCIYKCSSSFSKNSCNKKTRNIS